MNDSKFEKLKEEASKNILYYDELKQLKHFSNNVNLISKHEEKI